MRRRISRAQQTKSWCVGFSFPPPAYAGIHPTLYLFGFRANALNSHLSSYLPGFDPGSFLEIRRPRRPSAGLQGLPEFVCTPRTPPKQTRPPPHTPRTNQIRPDTPRTNFQVRMSGLVVGFAFFGLLSKLCPKFQYFPGLLQYRPGQGCSQDHGQKTPEVKVAGFRVS